MSEDWQKSYGPDYRAQKANKKKCGVAVHNNGGWGTSQCARKAVTDTNSEGLNTRCTQHSKAATALREAKAGERQERKRLAKAETDRNNV